MPRISSAGTADRARAGGRRRRGHVRPVCGWAALGCANGPTRRSARSIALSWRVRVLGSAALHAEAGPSGSSQAFSEPRPGRPPPSPGPRWSRGDEALDLVEGRQADVLGVEARRSCRPGPSPAAMRCDRVRDVLGQLLLGADQGAGGRVRGGQVLVDVHADAADAGVAGGLEHAVAGLAGDLEDDVDVGILLHELLGEGLPPAGSLKALRRASETYWRVTPDVRVDRLGAVLVARM